MTKHKLSNEKTKVELGLRYVIGRIDVLTPFGKKKVKKLRPFLPGSEGQLVKELDKLECLFGIIEKYEDAISQISSIFMKMKDNSFTLERSSFDILTMVELFEIKTFLLQLETLTKLYEKLGDDLPDEYIPIDTKELLDLMDPENSRLATFYIYDSFSEDLGVLRKEKRQLEKKLKKEQRHVKDQIFEDHALQLSPKFDIIISRSDDEAISKANSIPQLVVSTEDYASITYVLDKTEEQLKIRNEIEDLNLHIEDSELKVRKMLTGRIYEFSKIIKQNTEKIADLDFVIAKAKFARTHDCVKPEILMNHMINIEEGRYLPVENVLEEKGKSYLPITIQLKDGVTCITGANMGGKTVSMKLVGLHAMLAQYGFFVPCKKCSVGLSSYIHILVGDSQDIQRGLSSFGSEMEELAQILNRGKDRSLIFIDEIASSTNPSEGFALTKSMVEYLKDKPYICLITTHYENVSTSDDIKSLQVRGLADADFEKLSNELMDAEENARIDVIAGYMDYRLMDAQESKKVPKEALNIAYVLGVKKEIIDKAKLMIDNK